MSLERNRERYAANLAYEHDLTLPQGRKLAELAIHVLQPTFAPGSPMHLADPAVAVAFLDAPLGLNADERSVVDAGELVRRWVDAGFDTAGTWLGLARVAEHRGDVVAQRSHLETALLRDPDFGPALGDLGFLAFVEGDVAESRRLLRASKDPRCESMIHTLTHYSRPAASHGRNERCSCGSGRKHKLCCLARARHPLPDRAAWLWEKAGVWLRRWPQLPLLMDLACDLAGVDDPEAEEPLLAVVSNPVFEALALLDAGLLERFLTRMSIVLPEDERELAARWTELCHRVWRVEDTDPGRFLVLADLQRGQTIEARNAPVSRCTQPGELVFAAPIPTGDGWHLPCHPLCLSPREADVVLGQLDDGADPVAVAALLLRGHRNATM